VEEKKEKTPNRTVIQISPESAGQPKPALHPMFSENLGVLNYRELGKFLKNNSSGNSIDNPFSKPLMGFILFSFLW